MQEERVIKNVKRIIFEDLVEFKDDRNYTVDVEFRWELGKISISDIDSLISKGDKLIIEFEKPKNCKIKEEREGRRELVC